MNKRHPPCRLLTSLAGIPDGVIVDEALEAQAQQHGLKLLIDVRTKTQAWCFETYRESFTRAMACTQDPRKPNVRDQAIAQKVFTGYGYSPVTWCAARLPSNIRTVSPEELIWRIRMKHDQEQMQKQIELWPR